MLTIVKFRIKEESKEVNNGSKGCIVEYNLVGYIMNETVQYRERNEFFQQKIAKINYGVNRIYDGKERRGVRSENEFLLESKEKIIRSWCEI